MDSLHVTAAGQQTNSKTSSRSTSPCRPHPVTQTASTPHQHGHSHSHSHGSAESTKSHEGVSNVQHRHHHSRHRSPTSAATAAVMDDGSHRREPPEDPGSASVSGGGVLQAGAGESLLDESELLVSSFASNGSTEHVQYDESDGNTTRTLAAIEHLGNKISRTKDNIRTEQTLRDENVNEYLKLAANADKAQLQRIKAVFEKKNQKSAHVISQLQKKLDVYQKRMREYETHGVAGHRPPREVLRDMGQGLKNVGGNIRDGITGFSGSVMSKPREFAHLIKNKFGSADNINQLSTWYVGGNNVGGGTGSDGNGTNGGTGSDGGADKVHHGSATLPATLHSGASQSSMRQQHSSAPKFPSDEGSECSSVTSESIERYRSAQDSGSQREYNLKTVYSQLQQAQEEVVRLRDRLENMKALQQEVQFLSSALQEERFRADRLEGQVNDLTELHQNEVENLKQGMADMEEKVQYQSEERLRDIHEMLEHCQTKIQKMEHQALQQQQYVTLEGLDNSNARALVVKLINVLLTVLQVVLLLVATGAGIIMPFLRTRVRILTTMFLVLASVFILRQWPEIQDIGSHIMKRLKDTLDPVK